MRRLLSVILLGGVLLTACVSSDDGSSSRQATREVETVEWKLAVIDAGGFVDKNSAQVRRYKTQLDSAVSNCGNSRTNMADLAVRGVSILADRGQDASTYEVLQAVNQSLADVSGTQNCTEIIAALILLW